MALNSLNIKSTNALASLFSLLPTALLFVIVLLKGLKDSHIIYDTQTEIYKYYFIFVLILIFAGVFSVFRLGKYLVIWVLLIGSLPTFLYLSHAFSDYGIPLGVRLTSRGQPSGSPFVILQSAIVITIANYVSFLAFAVAYGIRSRHKTGRHTPDETIEG